MAKIICCLLNYKKDENANRLYKILSKKFDTYLIDTFHKDNGGQLITDAPQDKVILLNNVYWGGSQLEAYRILCENNGDYLLTIDTDIEIDDENADKMLDALDIFNKVDNIGVYTGTLEQGSKALGLTYITLDNSHLYNHNTGQLRDVFRMEGWLNVIKKCVLDDILPHFKLPDNKYGWGYGHVMCRRAIKRGLRIVADDRYCVFHPPGISYNNVEAQAEENRVRSMYKELDCILPEEEGSDVIRF